MRAHFRQLRLQQLEIALTPFAPARNSPRPSQGWIRAMRQACGISLQELAGRMRSRPPQIIQFEKSEAADRITLKSLRRAAEAMDCELVYALVPKRGSLQQAVEGAALAKAEREVRAVEHTMTLEDQAVGNVAAKVRQEAFRKLGK